MAFMPVRKIIMSDRDMGGCPGLVEVASCAMNDFSLSMVVVAECIRVVSYILVWGPILRDAGLEA